VEKRKKSFRGRRMLRREGREERREGEREDGLLRSAVIFIIKKIQGEIRGKGQASGKGFFCISIFSFC
jgi:hypothetical protein